MPGDILFAVGVLLMAWDFVLAPARQIERASLSRTRGRASAGP
jgi:hypothetical protein